MKYKTAFVKTGHEPERIYCKEFDNPHNWDINNNIFLYGNQESVVVVNNKFIDDYICEDENRTEFLHSIYKDVKLHPESSPLKNFFIENGVTVYYNEKYIDEKTATEVLKDFIETAFKIV